MNLGFTPEDLENMVIEMAHVDGFIWALDHVAFLKGEMRGWKIAKTTEINPLALNLIGASAHMYRTLGHHVSLIHALMEPLEHAAKVVKDANSGVENPFFVALIQTLELMEKASLDARRVAEVGPVQVMKELRSGG